MSRRQPLARRIVTAFVLLTVVVSGVFSMAVMVAVQQVESHLAAEELRAELDQITAQDSSDNDLPVMGANTRLYATYAPYVPVPSRYAESAVGFSHERFDDGDYYVYVLERDGERYVLEQRHSFAARERLMQLLVLAGFGAAVLASWLLGRLVARRVMMPVARLSRQVRNRDQLLACAPALAPEYARDEVGDLAVAFDDALAKLQHALERERLFTADVSHELRTPLMVIASSSELLVASELSPSQRGRLERISRAVDDMQAQVSALLLLARAEAGRKVSLGEDALLSQVAADQCQQWVGLMHEKGLHLECIGQAPSELRGPRMLLDTVIGNLLRNAWHYTEQGHVRLVLNEAGFRVEDSGIGIPEGQRQRVFERFAQTEPLRGDGLGLGLSLVQRICDRQGWLIEVQGLEAGGTCFSVNMSGAR